MNPAGEKGGCGVGGPGSGNHYHWWRPAKKAVVESCLWLDANRCAREGALKAGVRHVAVCTWFRDAARKEQTSSIGFEVNTRADPPWLRLIYTVTATEEAIDYRIGLEATRPQFGGLRWWFVCPLIVNGRHCGRRVGKLYLPPGSRYFGCRHCHRLTYTSCQNSRKDDALCRFMARNMGEDFHTVKRLMAQIGKGRG